MKIVGITDIHGHTERLGELAEELSAADVVLLCGDITHFGHRSTAEQVLAACRRHNPRILAVAGNCDYPDVEAYLAEEEISLHGTHVIVEEVAFLGVGGSLPCPGRTPNEHTEKDLEAILSQAAAGLSRQLPWVLVAHQPPRDTALDRVQSGAHVGSRAVREFILEYEPAMCLTGHIHESVGMDSLGPCKLVNPGPVGSGGYAYAEVNCTLELLEIRRPG
jgi:hypothetical protein